MKREWNTVFPELLEVEKARHRSRPWSAAWWEISYRYLHIATGTMVLQRLPKEPSLAKKRHCPRGQQCYVSISGESACRLRDLLVILVNCKLFKDLMERHCNSLSLIVTDSTSWHSAYLCCVCAVGPTSSSSSNVSISASDIWEIGNNYFYFIYRYCWSQNRLFFIQRKRCDRKQFN